MSGRARRRALLAADGVWLAFIFGNSLQNDAASLRESGALLALAARLVPALAGAPWGMLLLRKAAHFTEFFLLGALAAATLIAFGRPPARAGTTGAAAGLLAALCDETLQLAVPGRSGAVADIWLDWAGFLCGLALALGLIALRRHHKNKTQAHGAPGHPARARSRGRQRPPITKKDG